MHNQLLKVVAINGQENRLIIYCFIFTKLEEKINKVIHELGSENVLINEPLSKHSHIKIGGPADLFYIAKERADLIRAVQSAISNNVPFTVLGWGSNSLISDEGIRGLVIKNQYKNLEVLESDSEEEKIVEGEVGFSDARHETWKQDPNKVYSFDDLDYEEDAENILVRVSSGYDLPLLIIDLLNLGITGMQWFAGIPGTLAGAVVNNIHGGTKLFGELVDSAIIINPKSGDLAEVDSNYFQFDYDESVLHKNDDTLIDIKLKLKKGDVEKAKYVRSEWMIRKAKSQPQNSLGCTFANPPKEISDIFGFPTPSVGYFVEHVMGWKDKKKIGGASMGRGNGHAGFICNDGDATAKDYIKIMKKVHSSYKSKTGYDLIPEIFFLGEFENDDFVKIFPNLSGF